MSCEYYPSCAFIENMTRTDPLTAETVRLTYCDHDKYGCARYGLLQVMTAEDVPDFLWPNDEEEALELIKVRSRNNDNGYHLMCE
ncbi:MAG TPA: hypothetical protein VK187_10250 [Geobacteraceae bacterium]|nr:hypothetical protein [Geobacteraceae bacterium]